MRVALLYSSLLLASACANPAPLTQLIIAVAADDVLTPKLAALRVQLWAPASAGDAERQEIIPLGELGARLPLSFGIVREELELLRLSVQGCASTSCDMPLVERKLLVRFVPQQTMQIDVTLSATCAEVACTGFGQTCERGSCVAVHEVTGQRIEARGERFPFVPVEARDASPNVIEPPLSDGSTDGGDDASELPAPNICPTDNSCAEAYPCIPDDGASYVCRGQYADWPMPDSTGTIAPRYDDRVPGVLRDEVTGLSWQLELPSSFAGCTGKAALAGDGCTFAQAGAYCAQLAVAGGGWRVPSKIELESLLDLRPDHSGFDGAPLLGGAAREHWTSSPFPEMPGTAYLVEFGMGISAIADTSKFQLVRCVRSPAESPRAVERYAPRSNDRTVAAARTKLTWSSLPYCTETMTYQQASDWCAGWRPGEGWRLPTNKELLTLVDPTRSAPAIDSAFAGTPNAGWTWSSTPGRDGAGHRLVELAGGVSFPESMALQIVARTTAEGAPNTFCARCVR
jgi:Protein of unknown function (DUF1566)